MQSNQGSRKNTYIESLLRLANEPKLIINSYSDTDECLCFTENECSTKYGKSQNSDKNTDDDNVRCCQSLVWTDGSGIERTFVIGSQVIDGYPVYENVEYGQFIWWMWHGETGQWSINE